MSQNIDHLVKVKLLTNFKFGILGNNGIHLQ